MCVILQCVILANKIFKCNFKILRELKLYFELLKARCLSERYLTFIFHCFLFFILSPNLIKHTVNLIKHTVNLIIRTCMFSYFYIYTWKIINCRVYKLKIEI